MTFEKEVHVKSNLDRTWKVILNMLAFYGYKIINTYPQSQIIAERGSKLVSGVVGGTTGGHRSVTIRVLSSESDIQIKFAFTFSAFGFGSAYKGSKDEIDKMIQDIEYELSKEEKILLSQDVEKIVPQIPPMSSTPNQIQQQVSSPVPILINIGKVGDDSVVVKDSILQRSNISGKENKPFNICPFCGEELNLPKTPKFCPYCKEQMLSTKSD